MAQTWEFDQYEALTLRAASDFKIPLVRSIEEANAGWGLRKLSRSEFDELATQSKTDLDLRERWLNRLENGYDREKSQIAIEIEELFSDVLYATPFDRPEQVDAA
ncbi:MAG: hypothetical protein AABP62_07635 [Planctomycetota bacterium]